MSNIYTKIRHEVTHLFSKRLEKKAERSLRKHSDLWDYLAEYKSRSNSTGCDFVDYLAIFRHVRKHKPKEILECGTGVSTVVLAYALKKNEEETGVRGRITSMEESKEWFDHARSIFPKELSSYVDMVLSPTVEDSHSFLKGVRYKDLPRRKYSFVFIDGPDPFSEKGETLFDFDFISVVSQSDHPVYGIIDNRTSTCYSMHAIFGDEKFSFDYLRKIGFVGPCRREDLGSARQIVARAMKLRTFKRPENFFASLLREML